MQTFLQLVANDLKQRTGGDFSRTLVVFPGKRAGLFLDEYLAESDMPLWSPRYITITDLFRLFCPLTPADPIETACRIHEIYVDILKSGRVPLQMPEKSGKMHAAGSLIPDLDRFYGWAERLLGDFDEIDKALVDARALFVNLGDLREIEAKDFLTQQQKEVLRQFFKDFDPDYNSYIRDRFLQLWRCMPEIYNRLRQNLEADGLAYDGMLQRYAVENLKTGRAALPKDVERIAIVGFNVLSEVERRLFKLLQKEVETLFYWDYDTFSIREGTEAGHFMRRNLRDFPNTLSEEVFDNLLQPKEVTFVSATSDNAQARYVAPWLRENLTKDARRTAVVLCDENLLQPVLHGLPEEVQSINITKGYPLAATETYAQVLRKADELEKNAIEPGRFIEKLQAVVDKHSKSLLSTSNSAEFMVQSTADSTLLDTVHSTEAGTIAVQSTAESAVESTLQPSVESTSNPISATTPNSTTTSDAQNSSFPTEILEQEARFLVHTVLVRFAHLVAGGRLTVATPVLRKLFKQVMRRQTIPFHGEPVEGLQIMGVLETRCLDFESLIVLSADDKHLPRAETDNSFIPYFLREAYGLPTRRENAAVYAYYFHHLIARSRRVAFVWSAADDGAGCGEMSRFMTQLLVEAPQLHIRRLALQARSLPTANAEIEIEKPADIADRLTSLSPSALNEYLLCPAKFYFHRVSRLKAHQEPTEGMAQNVFGTIFHEAAQMLYTDLSRNLKKPITAAVISHFLDDAPERKLLEYIRLAFEKTQNEEETLTGTPADYPVECEVLLRMLKDLLRTEQKLGEIRLIALEKEFFTEVEISTPSGRRKLPIGGVVDRLDLVKNAEGKEVVRVLDYKTGAKKDAEKFKSVDALFKQGSDRAKYIFQTFLYALAVEKDYTQPISPALHYTGAAHKADYTAYVPLGKDAAGDVRPFLPDFRTLLTDLVQEICDSSRPFKANPQENSCRYCDFRHICLN